MSLINDALRRAKQAQPAPSAPSPSTLRPVEQPAQSARHGLLLPVSLGAVALLILISVWILSRRDGSSGPTQPQSTLAVAARTLPQPDTTAVASEPAVQPATATATVSTPGSAATLSKPGPETTPVSKEQSAVSASGTSVPSGSAEPSDTNHLVTAEPPVPAPPPLKLQGITFNPKRPSAMISGRVVFIGDKVRDLRVITIKRNEVVLVSSGQTNSLSLEP
jgi:hypothetical protein